jgi:NAD(P)-dependent dehydrogenase (short-subunit alcohol dehydrogenase family)
MDVKGHSAIVTGGGSGLGEATAKMLAAKGAKVAILDMNMKGAERVAKEIGGVAIECNVADVPSAEKAFAAAKQAVGAARVLVNCAGIGSGELLVKKDGSPSGVDLFLKTVAVNLFGTFNCMRLGVYGGRPCWSSLASMWVRFRQAAQVAKTTCQARRSSSRIA